jgi:hypothetical protein
MAFAMASPDQRIKLSDFAEEFFRRLALNNGLPMLLRKGELHRLVPYVNPTLIDDEVRAKLDALQRCFEHAIPDETPTAG